MTLVENLLRSFRHYLNPMQIAELEQFRREAKAKNLFMLNYPAETIMEHVISSIMTT